MGIIPERMDIGGKRMKISDAVSRLDSVGKLKGESHYIEDYKFDGMLHAKTLRSTVASGVILAVHYPPLPEHVYKIDSADVPAYNQVAMITRDMPVFACDRVTYIGEPIALILSEDRDAVIAYMKEIRVDYQLDAPIFTMEDALAVPGSILTEHEFKRGDLTQLNFDQEFTETFETTYQEQLYMEKQGMIATYDGNLLTVYGSLQCPYYVLNALKHAIGFDETSMRVVQATTGGAFGGKEEYPSLLACQVATAAIKLKRPISLIFDRREDIAFTTKRHPSKTRITSFLKEGKLVGMNFDISMDAGSYIGLSDVVLQRAILTMTGAYQIENLKVSGRTIRTNNVFTGAFRGFGAPQSMYALELHMNHLAKRLGEDPLHFRQKYYVKQGQLTATGGIFHESIYLEELTDQLKELTGYDSRTDTGKPYIGYGISVVPHGGGFTGDGEATHIKAIVKLRKETNQKVSILVSNVEMGQGAKTALSKIVASVLGISIERIDYENPDTSQVPDSGPTVASRTTMVVGGLLAKAAERLKDRMEEEGQVVIEEHFKQPDYVVWNQDTLQGNAYMAYSWSAVMARVEIDPVSYEVNCTDIWGCYDVGVPIDEQLMIGQVQGGIVQGLGYALMENMTSKQGQIEQIAFSSYPIPTAMDVPRMHIQWLINPFEDGPFGAKSAGELTLVGVAPAVSAAIEDALGIETHQIPVTPEVIERLLS